MIELASSGTLPKRILGKTGLEVTMVSLGGVGIGAKDSQAMYGGITDGEAVATVQRALERGVNFIDTSPLYIESERRIGLALRDLRPGDREKLVICTKVGDECPPFSDNGGHSPFSAEGVRSSVAHSMKVLGLEYLDLVLLHDCTAQELDEFLSPGAGMDALRALKKEGIVRHMGIGTWGSAEILRFLEECPDCEVVLAVNAYNLLRTDAVSELFPTTVAKNVGVINASIYYLGLLAAPKTSWNMGFKKTLDKPELKDLALRMEAWWESECQLPLRIPALQFGLRHDAVACTPIGCRTAQEVDEVCDAMSETNQIREEVWRAFEGVFGQELQEFKRDWHWFYVKGASKID